MDLHRLFRLAVGAFVMLSGQVVISAEPPAGYVCHRALSPIDVDGKLDDKSWANATWSHDFVDIEGDKKPRPRFSTKMMMLWDDKYLYIGAKLEEPHVWGTLTEHDSVIFHDNDFEVFIDPNGDNHDYCELELNVLNTEWDLRLPKPYRDGGQAENEFELPGLKTAVHIDGTLNNPRDVDQGWTVEIAIPWTALKGIAHRPSPPAEGDQWRINFSRVEWLSEIVDGKYVKVPKRPEDNWVWSPQGVVDMHRPERWGFLQFTSKPAGQVTFSPDPTVPIRDRLVLIYQAQRTFHKVNGRWADTLDKLGATKEADCKSNPMLLLSHPQGFKATIDFSDGMGPVKRWNIREDSWIWAE